VSCSITSESDIRILAGRLPAAIAVLDRRVKASGDLHRDYIGKRLAACGSQAEQAALLLSGAIDTPFGALSSCIDQDTGDVVVDGFDASFEDYDSDDPVAEVLEFIAELAPSLADGVIGFSVTSAGVVSATDYEVSVAGGALRVGHRPRWVRNSAPFKMR
jgi:hypothetical protein